MYYNRSLNKHQHTLMRKTIKREIDNWTIINNKYSIKYLDEINKNRYYFDIEMEKDQEILLLKTKNDLILNLLKKEKIMAPIDNQTFLYL